MTTISAADAPPRGAPPQRPARDVRSRRTREVIPMPPSSVAPQAAVAERLARADGGVAVVVAPGGYGKTSQVALWASSDGRTVAWADLEPADDDPACLLEVVIEALARAGVTIDAPAGGRRTAHLPATITARQLGRAMSRVASPFVLVIDDVHHLRNRSSIDLLDALIRRVPAGSTIVLIGRTMPALGLASLRAQNRVIDVSTDTLSLDASAARAVAVAMDVQPADETIAQMMRETDGWPLGVHLAVSALGDAGAPVSGDPGIVSRNYVEDEWLRGLEPADADLLRRVSGLGWVSGPLCDHVLDASDSGSRLERLHASGLLIAPLDRRGDSYRVHQVLRDALDQSYERRDRAGHRSVNQRACEWFESTGDIDRAVEQALRVGDVARAGDLVIAHGARFHTQGRTETVKRWIEQLPQQHVMASASLCLIAGVASLGSGDGEAAAAWVRFGEYALTHGDDPDGMIGPKLQAFRSMLWLDPIAESLEMAEHACDVLPPGLWSAVARVTGGALRFALGHDDEAISALSIAAADCRLLGVPSIEAIGLAHHALVVGADDRWDEALRLARRARRLLADQQLEHMPTTALVTAASALAESTCGDVDQARSDILLTRTSLALVQSVADWHHVQARVALASASLRLGDLVAARTFEQEAAAIAKHHADAVRYQEQIDDLASRLHSARDVLPFGPSSLTTAELRVLHYLPTNLSHEEIAGRLYVSRNTAKSHAAAIYRKLGASSRGEAVEVARLSGLLPNA